MTLSDWAFVLAPATTVAVFMLGVRMRDREKISADLLQLREAQHEQRAHVAESYVSKAGLATAVAQIEKSMESGFNRIDEKIDLLFDRAQPRGRRAPAPQ